ncbi:MAG: hypothetical protein U5Q44_09270 [Dehalococcoidia bacterium]|nr:hypothetical protein [Dehalococcoidia bacterium]
MLLKLDAVHSREPVIQQLGRGLRYNHNLTEAENVLNVYVGRDPRMQAMVEFLENESQPGGGLKPIEAQQDEDEPGASLEEDEPEADEDEEEEEQEAREIRDVYEAGDAYVDHTGRIVEGQQMTMFGVEPPEPAAAPSNQQPHVEVVDLDAELREAVRFCTEWTNRAARERARKYGRSTNHHQYLNAEYGRLTGKRGSLSTPEDTGPRANGCGSGTGSYSAEASPDGLLIGAKVAPSTLASSSTPIRIS